MPRTTTVLPAFFAVLLAALPLAAQDEVLPAGPVDVALWGADVRVTLEPGATARVVARAFRRDPATGEYRPVEEEAVRLHTVRPNDDEAVQRILRGNPDKDVRLSVDLTLDAFQPLKVAGRDLVVDVKASPVDSAELAGFQDLPPARQPGLTLAVADSEVTLTGLFAVAAEGRGSRFVSRNSTGQLTLELEGGKAEVHQHDGRLELGGDGELDVLGAAGRAVYEVQGGRLAFSAFRGTIEGHADDTRVTVDDFAGTLHLESSGGGLELRAAGSAVAASSDEPSEVVARGSEVVFGGWARGEVHLVQEGGSLAAGGGPAEEAEAGVTLDASAGAEVALTRIGGEWTVQLRDAAVEVAGAEGLKLTAATSRVEVTQVERLVLRTSGSEVHVSEIEELELLTLAGSNGDIQLNGGERSEVELLRSSNVTVTVPQPCWARSVTGRGELTASGCEVLTPTTFAPGGDDVTVLTFAMDDDCIAQVVGH